MRLVKEKMFIYKKIPKLDVVGSMPISRAPIIKNSRQREALPSKTPAGRSGRLPIDSWTEQHPQILFSRIISANIAERARSRSRSGGVLSTANTASAGIRRHPPARAAILAVLQNFCGPLGQSVLTTGQPQAKASAITNPSQAEERTKTEARAM